MKHLLTLALLLMAPLLGRAQTATAPQGHALILFSESYTPFYLELDGQRMGETPLSHVSLVGLPKDRYQARLVFVNQALPTLEGTIECAGLEPGFHEVTYAVSFTGQAPQLYGLRWRSLEGPGRGVGTPGQQHAVALDPLNTTQAATVQDKSVAPSFEEMLKRLNEAEAHLRGMAGSMDERARAHAESAEQMRRLEEARRAVENERRAQEGRPGLAPPPPAPPAPGLTAPERSAAEREKIQAELEQLVIERRAFEAAHADQQQNLKMQAEFERLQKAQEREQRKMEKAQQKQQKQLRRQK